MRPPQLNPAAPPPYYSAVRPPYSAVPPPYYYYPYYLPTHQHLPTHQQQLPPFHYTTHPRVPLYNQHLPIFHRPPADHFPANARFNEVVPEVNAVEEAGEKPAEEKSESPKTPVPARRNFNGRRVTRSFNRNTRSNFIWRRVNGDTTPPAPVINGDTTPPAPVINGDTTPPAPANCDELLPENTEKTTVMIRNIPYSVRRSFMLKILDEVCRRESIEYDFMYLPIDFASCTNRGYAFANFTTVDSANKFKKSLHGFNWKNVQTRKDFKKICEISWGNIQGKDCLVRHFGKKVYKCDRPEFLPVLLDPPRNGMNPNPPPPVVIGKLHRRS